ncbi:MAG: VIT1/CCC1 transporter family protein [Acidimicrobiia bacterium]|nr:VIT1/CCC1 transporter family protein [Acidimicrobiia bacterium]
MTEHHHRDIRGGTARAAVFGVSDGLVSNVSLVLGVAAGAHDAQGAVRLAGLAGLIAGAVSMAIGEYVSMTAQAELLQRELDLERRELKRVPEAERRELAHIYRSRGVDAETADTLASEMMRDPDLALETHAREELGIDPNALGSPIRAAASSFVSFAIGALIPLLPWFFGGGRSYVAASIVLGAVAAFAVGAALARFTGRSVVRSAGRQLLLSAVAAAITYGIGAAVGVATG